MVFLTIFRRLPKLAPVQMNKRFLPILIFAAGLGLCSQFSCAEAGAAPTNLVALASGSAAPPAESITPGDAFRSYLQLQEQLHETQLAIERAEREMELATLRSAAILSNRLQAIEQTVELQRTHEREIVRDMMLIAGAFVVIGVFALLLTSYFHWRAVSRLGEIAAALPVSRGLGEMPSVAALGMKESPLLLEQTNSRLLGAIERLEKRIAELEHGDARNLANGSAPAESHEENIPTPEALPEMSVRQTQTKTATGPDQLEQVLMLLGKGQSLLSQDQVEPAIACFDEALTLDPRHTELLVKKGDALEKLRRTKEALECYDRALAIDDSLTIAYLHKGGLLNRVERFDEAMHCYEQALRTQDKDRAA